MTGPHSTADDAPDSSALPAQLSSLRLDVGLTSALASQLIAAFSPQTSDSTSRATAITAFLQLASGQNKTPEVIGEINRDRNQQSDIAVVLAPVILRQLVSDDVRDAEAALRCLAALFAVLPAEAHTVLTNFDIHQAIESLQQQAGIAAGQGANEEQNHRLNLATAHLLSAALSHKPTRTTLSADKSVRERLSHAILSTESSTTDAGHDTQTNAATAAGREGQVRQQRRWSRRIAIAAGAAKFKFDVGATAAEANLGLGGGLDGSKAEKDKRKAMEQAAKQRQDNKARNQQEDAHLLSLVRQNLVERTSSGFSGPQCPDGGGSKEEEQQQQRQTLLTTLECLTYLSLSPHHRDAITRDAAFLSALGSVLKIPSSRRSVFPSRQQAAGETTATQKSSYDIDPSRPPSASTSSSAHLMIDADRYDTALQYGLASVLHNLVSYPAVRTDEEKQMEKLNAMVNAQGQGSSASTASSTAAADEEKIKRLESSEEVEKRCRRVLDAGLVAALVGIATAGPPPTMSKTGESGSGVNPSPAIRQAVAATLHSLVTKQDKAVRGTVVQQGGLKAILSLSAPVYASLAASSPGRRSSSSVGLFATGGAAENSDAASTLTPLQTLAKILITVDPILVFGSVANCASVVPLLSALFLAPDADRLQTFEAALALTNLSSLSTDLATSVASFRIGTDGHGNGNDETVARRVETILLSEDHELTRRATTELLCNLLQDEGVWERWSGEDRCTDDDVRRTTTEDGRVKTRLHVLVSLLSVDDLATRLAAAACLATLSASPAACSVILRLEAKSVAWLVKTLGVPLAASIDDDDDDDDGEEDEEEEEAIWDQATSLFPPFLPPPWTDIGREARRDLNRLGLAVRTLSCLANLVGFPAYARREKIRAESLSESQQTREKLEKWGVAQGIKLVLLREVEEMRKGGRVAGKEEGKEERQTRQMVETQRTQVVNLAVEVLKRCQEAGMAE